MELKAHESSGGIAPVAAAADPKASPSDFSKTASSPLGKDVSLASISGPTYVTSQLLVQQTAYKLSDKIFSFSPETFDLDGAVKSWSSAGEKNLHGETTTVVPLQTRIGAGAFALGYIFSKDFDLSKRHIPQTLLAPSLSLRHLRTALDQLSLLYGVASPFVAHIAAADYSANEGLVTEYESALQTAEDLGLALVSSSSAYEVQHISLLATLLASVLPTLHVYDGLRTARETLRVVDALSEESIAEHYKQLTAVAGKLNKRLDAAGKVVELLHAFNEEFGTSYAPFEYHGHEAPETVLVVFGSAESQIAKQVANALAGEDKRVGVVNVRVYRPFIEEAFLEALPHSVRTLAVLGQVRDSISADDASIQSALYADVLTAVSFTDKWAYAPEVVDFKYAASEAQTPSSIASILLKFSSKDAQAATTFSLHSLDETQKFTFWDVDNSTAVEAPSVLGTLLAQESTSNVSVHEVYDNLLQGGVIRTDIRSAKKSIQAPYDIDNADVAFVGEEKLLNEIAILKGVKAGGKVILRLPNLKDEDLEKRIPAPARKEIQDKGLQMFALDTSFSPALEKEAQLLVELAFLKVARPELTTEQLAKFTWIAKDQAILAESADSLEQALRKIEVPATWAELPADMTFAPLAPSVTRTSFAPFQKEEVESVLDLRDWQSAAKGLAFKEAYGTQTSLRPDLTVKTFTIHVKENRRLTPQEYDRNIFHIEFDLGNSGLTYNIGEALGIHAENDPAQVLDFIQSYGLNADELVEVPSREDPAVSEIRTVYQSLVQNIDILGKPPKRFFESLAEFATDEKEKKKLEFLGGKEGADEFKKLSEVDTVTYVDILEDFKSARPSFHDLVRIVSPLKRREYSIASAQAVTPNSVALMIVVVDWVDTKGRTRYGQATRYLSGLAPGTAITASVKPSVMKLPVKDTAPLIMAGLGTGLAPFRAFVQYRAMQKAQGKEIGSILLYLGSRHQREEYLYGEEWEAYMDAGVITLLGAAFSRDQPQKIYIQDRMRQTMSDIVKAYIEEEGSFYLCGPTWPVPDVTEVLQEAIATQAKKTGRKVDSRKEIERLKEDGRLRVFVFVFEELDMSAAIRVVPSKAARARNGSSNGHTSRRGYAAASDAGQLKEYAFEMAASSIRFGPGVTQEVGMDLRNMGAKRVAVVTDETVDKLDAMRQVREALDREGVSYQVYNETKVEPKDYSVKEAIAWAKPYDPDAFLAVGGGSVIDTAKLMNLYACYPEADFLDFVNAPLGKGLPIERKLRPLIAVPTTAGTGSETTGTAIFDLASRRAKTGVAHRNLKPTLGICDPLNTRTMPAAVKAASGLDVLCHSLESWTAIPFNERVPRPTNPILRPAYQGANPISDIFSLAALRATVKYLPRAVRDPSDLEAQSEMLLAATLAGVGFGNAGVHLCHGMSYPISGQNPAEYKHKGYDVSHPIIPHGVSVAVTAPTVFRFTAASNPERHLAAAEAFGVDISNVKLESAGEVLAEALAKFLADLGDQPRGLKDLGFGMEHVEELVDGTIPQKRVLMLAPGLDADSLEREREQLRGLFEGAMEH
ncbi:sulfite reductase [NADPH] flavoprotein component-like protein [Cercophora newfieldiana]|uniref:Sulfite reductase [NADPH] flavoprotein component-like protein n=1 Tax=Cercophora newfieldiana TaxID=92897 RepID=A0AA39XVZ8_9PEZI|nr:sulfite reductase [NADPH] flavoprotein component-like protein [Cercophora newfieldiana]